MLVIDKYPWKAVSMSVFYLNVLQKYNDDYIKNNETCQVLTDSYMLYST